MERDIRGKKRAWQGRDRGVWVLGDQGPCTRVMNCWKWCVLVFWKGPVVLAEETGGNGPQSKGQEISNTPPYFSLHSEQIKSKYWPLPCLFLEMTPNLATHHSCQNEACSQHQLVYFLLLWPTGQLGESNLLEQCCSWFDSRQSPTQLRQKIINMMINLCEQSLKLLSN